jgi:mono/diheme cytochrome c family protein
MKRMAITIIIGLFFMSGWVIFTEQGQGADKNGGYLLPGDLKEGWKVFMTKKCGACHSIWGEGGKGGPDLGTLPASYVSQSQLAALLWNHLPEMWGSMSAKRIPLEKIDPKEMADLFAFLYFIRYMDEPGDGARGKRLVEAKSCTRCHGQEDFNRWGRYTNPILWSQMMWNHTPQMGQAMRDKQVPRVEFEGNEMVDLIAYVRSLNPKAEKVYLSPGDPQQGAHLFSTKECVKCHPSGGSLDLTQRKDFPRTLAQLAGLMWNHSYEMWRRMEEKGIRRHTLSPQEMADITAYLFSTRYFDSPGDPGQGKAVFLKKRCNLCHGKGKTPDLSGLKGKISPILMAQVMWNHGPQMLDEMRKAKMPWQKIDGKEMIDLMEYLNRGMP